MMFFWPLEFEWRKSKFFMNFDDWLVKIMFFFYLESKLEHRCFFDLWNWNEKKIEILRNFLCSIMQKLCFFDLLRRNRKNRSSFEFWWLTKGKLMLFWSWVEIIQWCFFDLWDWQWKKSKLFWIYYSLFWKKGLYAKNSL